MVENIVMDFVLKAPQSKLVEEWQGLAADVLLVQRHQKGVMEAGVNDLYTLIAEGLLPPPPVGDSVGRRGACLQGVFTSNKFYEKVPDKMVVGVNPASKRRKVCVWKYHPIDDQRTENKKSDLTEDLRET